jgi:hypothetical protein
MGCQQGVSNQPLKCQSTVLPVLHVCMGGCNQQDQKSPGFGCVLLWLDHAVRAENVHTQRMFWMRMCRAGPVTSLPVPPMSPDPYAGLQLWPVLPPAPTVGRWLFSGPSLGCKSCWPA